MWQINSNDLVYLRNNSTSQRNLDFYEDHI